MRPLDPLTARPLAIALAVALDLAFGDPRSVIHPVAWLGALIARLERVLRDTSALSGRIGGAVLTIVVVAVATGCAYAVSLIAWRVSTVLGVFADTLLIWLTLAARSLATEGRTVAGLLVAKDLPAARKRLSRIVARETDGMDETGAARAAVESLGENVVDGVVAPLFWTAVLGPTGAWLHKAASTLDSMVGYRTAQYARFGTASARLDDLLAWIPARIAPVLISVAALVSRCDACGALKVGWRDRLKHDSPNSAHGEAAFAGALGVQLGGPVAYPEGVVHRPAIGDKSAPPPCAASVYAAARLVIATCLVAGATAVTIIVLVRI